MHKNSYCQDGRLQFSSPRQNAGNGQFRAHEDTLWGRVHQRHQQAVEYCHMLRGLFALLRLCKDNIFRNSSEFQ